MMDRAKAICILGLVGLAACSRSPEAALDPVKPERQNVTVEGVQFNAFLRKGPPWPHPPIAEGRDSLADRAMLKETGGGLQWPKAGARVGSISIADQGMREAVPCFCKPAKPHHIRLASG
jgi:hypothetical protein